MHVAKEPAGSAGMQNNSNKAAAALLTRRSMPKQAPDICAMRYASPAAGPMCPLQIVAIVTAGFRWPPDTFAVAYTACQKLSEAAQLYALQGYTGAVESVHGHT